MQDEQVDVWSQVSAVRCTGSKDELLGVVPSISSNRPFQLSCRTIRPRSSHTDVQKEYYEISYRDAIPCQKSYVSYFINMLKYPFAPK